MKELNDKVPRFMMWLSHPFDIRLEGPEVIEVDGQVKQHFGIHSRMNEYHLTHLPTGMRLTPSDGATERACKELVEEIHGLLPDSVDMDEIRESEAADIVDEWKDEVSGG
ncbi:MAG: hypothetical protein U5L04_02490 [Trueperaceae bacterium]|nr:hypothetical protein [Trueperaceae bacterium]